VAELRFRLGAIFPADNPTAVYAMAVSVALGDLRTVGELEPSPDAPDHVRLYLLRLLEAHVGAGMRLAVDEYRERDDVRRFVAILPDEGRSARDELERLADAGAAPRPVAPAEPAHLRDALELLEGVESDYRVVGAGRRADYADLVVAATPSQPGGDVPLELPALVAARRGRLDPLLPPLETFLEHAEAAWLRPWRG
jgi:hypothetical protein